ncbi:Lrp/AsnC family transcriptional regulator [Burkholderiaceae bacterium DAT-1]|nr:Lrp/AsnC family transcriptional regulator [Burkholderiaceae bacterium DAT-1]
MNDSLDLLDRKILAALQSDGRLSNARLAEQLGMSETPCWRRLRRLEQDGYIRGYQARLDRKRLGLGVIAFVQISLASHSTNDIPAFEAAVQGIDEIVACHNIAGESDYILEVMCADLDAYGDFVRDVLRSLPGVSAIRSSLALREVKSSGALPIRAAR